jgi:hypothetical protein
MQELADPGITNFSPPSPILTQKNTLVEIECKLKDNITRFTLSTFSELLAAPIIVTLF